jgi:hypothetical protein
MYQFLCLSFGIKIAPWVFTKLIKVPVSYIRRQGIRLVIDLGDIHVRVLILSESKQTAVLNGITEKGILESPGLMINLKISIFTSDALFK